jgi:hypothetical protein
MAGMATFAASEKFIRILGMTFMVGLGHSGQGE